VGEPATWQVAHLASLSGFWIPRISAIRLERALVSASAALACLSETAQMEYSVVRMRLTLSCAGLVPP
jgi:hypothetical protein